MGRSRAIDDLRGWITHAEQELNRQTTWLSDMGHGGALRHWHAVLSSCKAVDLLSSTGFLAEAVLAGRLAGEHLFAMAATLKDRTVSAKMAGSSLKDVDRAIRMGRDEHHTVNPLTAGLQGDIDAAPRFETHPEHVLKGPREIAERAGLLAIYGTRYSVIAAVADNVSFIAVNLPDMMQDVLDVTIDAVTEFLQQSCAEASAVICKGIASETCR